jgi:membrane fusion protein (multidrug efflux system)
MQAREQEKPTEPAEGQPTLQAVPDAPPKKKKRLWLFVVLAILVLLAVFKGIQYVAFARTHVTTDNAFLDADITEVSAQVSGIVKQILVHENDHVRTGQLLAIIDDSNYKAAVSQAQANLNAAIAGKQSADADVALSRKISQGQLTQAQGGVVQAQSGVGMAEADLTNANAAIQASRAAEGGATAQALQAGVSIQVAIQNKARAVQAVTSAKAQLHSAQAALKAAQAGVKSAQAHQTYAQSQASRFETLAAQGAVSRQQADAARQDLDTANAALQSAEAQVTSAEAAVEDREAAVQSAQQGIPLADSAIAQARAGAQVAQQQRQAAAASLQESIAHRANIAQGIKAAQGKTTQALGQQQSADTVNQVLTAKLAAAQQAEAKVEQAKAALDQANLDLKRTRIYAPVDGTVNKSSVQEGATITPGLPLMAVVRENSLYVDVNLKETQTAKLVVGQVTEIDIDGFPAHPFKGHLTSLSPATGATFALLPPDNASGNFVKVVQRIPVRVDFDPGQPDLDKLRAGMSASVAIKTG